MAVMAVFIMGECGEPLLYFNTDVTKATIGAIAGL
jgi:hypothetical protein